MKICRDKILEYHKFGKIGMIPSKPLDDVEALSMAYTPGVAEAVRALAASEDMTRELTAKNNLVAIVSDGTAILGLGDLGATASIPVLEGKAVLFKKFADVEAWPVPLDFCRHNGTRSGRTDPERIIDTTARISCMYGGINLEDIAAPECFEIERRLDEMLDIPVFHDDQWGTAVVTLAALLNYSELAGLKPPEMRVVINGAGAAGIRIADMLKAAGASSVVLCDTKGVIHNGRTDLNEMKRRHASDTRARVLGDAMRGAHVFIGVSSADCLRPEHIRAMSPFPAIFAMANPDPEIRPELVAETMGSKPFVMATGRSDYPNQINNVLGFPFLFRGALDAKARTINMEMKTAAARALALLAREPAPPALSERCKGRIKDFGPDYIVPNIFDCRLMTHVSLAVAEAAIRSGAGAGEPAELRAGLEGRARRLFSAP